MTSFGPVHTLIVRVVGEDDEFHTNDFEDFEVKHSPECKQWHDDNWDCDRYSCGVGENIENTGLRWSMRYSGCKITEPGTYKIQAWAETIRGFDYTEYDGGIGFADEDDRPVSSEAEQVPHKNTVVGSTPTRATKGGRR